ncbi:MFS transporter [Massilia sp. GCM10020059]|uniref:MFS transporter n=1 Tax=Massilia agrisoli TaxID=2892444 RepID=A0ABS8ISV9_9BURK|nr:MFS transporter [Massilia agrisoli]MCC6070798.1 MFS transporter [Massilia agrisoli]
MMESSSQLQHGIRPNLTQFLHQLLQVLLVGLTLGMMRTVVPALAESEFGVPKTSFVLLTAFVVAFGVVKAGMNFLAGEMSERIGRKNVLLLGWAVALPIPVMVWHAPNWGWVVAATVLLGVNQGMAWSMTQAAKLDMTLPAERGLTMGLNEFAGYAGVALGGIVTALLATLLGAREGLLVFGLLVIVGALAVSTVWVRDTLPWARAEVSRDTGAPAVAATPRYPRNVSDAPGAWEVFAVMSWRDRRMFALSQAGLVEKFVDALVWVFYPVYLYQRGLSLAQVAWVTGVYGLVWGACQLFTGHLSDHIGRRWPNLAGMFLCAIGVGMMVVWEGVNWWAASAALTGFGMALLYPNLSAAVADISPPRWRGTAIGIYRFWRDLGYGIGALGLGLTAHFTGQVEEAFIFVALAMFASGALLWWLGEETHPHLNPAISTSPPTPHSQET